MFSFSWCCTHRDYSKTAAALEGIRDASIHNLSPEYDGVTINCETKRMVPLVTSAKKKEPGPDEYIPVHGCRWRSLIETLHPCVQDPNQFDAPFKWDLNWNGYQSCISWYSRCRGQSGNVSHVTHGFESQTAFSYDRRTIVSNLANIEIALIHSLSVKPNQSSRLLHFKSGLTWAHNHSFEDRKHSNRNSS